MIYPQIEMPGGGEWVIILVIVVLVFGAAKLPELARGAGQAIRIFKAETSGGEDVSASPGDKPGARVISPGAVDPEAAGPPQQQRR